MIGRLWPRMLLGRQLRAHFGLLLTATLACTGCSQSETEITLQGSGATFPAPLYKRWFLEYYKKNPDVRVNYQAIGSGAGIRQFGENLTKFGASDAYKYPEFNDALKKKGAKAFLLPMTAGSIVLCYNLPDGPSEIKLPRSVYGDIFLGKIKKWSDKRISDINPGVPDLPITVVRRADSSGTTHAFTNHLSAISAEWKNGPGTGTQVEWPTGLAGRGNAGVAAIVQLTPGAIGYTEFSYAKLANLPMASLENRTGKFVQPNAESNRIALAAGLKQIPDDFHIDLPDPDGEMSYPIVTCTWMLVFTKYDDPRVGKELKNVLHFCLGEGQTYSADLHYIPLPEELLIKVRRKVEEIEVGE